jgi:hypothetical protein
MIRHGWTLAFGVGLCAGLLVGCAATQRCDTTESVANPAPDDAAPLAALPPASSPYHVQPVEPPAVKPHVAVEMQPAAPPPMPVVTAPPAPQPVEPGPVVQAAALEPVPAPPPKQEDPPVVAALRSLIEKPNEDATNYLLKLDPATQELLLRLLPVVARLGAGNFTAAKPDEIRLVLYQLESALAAVKPRAQLVVDRMVYARDIERFGVYQPLPDDYPFRPGEVADIYVEVHNFASESHGPFYEVHLAGTLEVAEPGGATRPLRVLPDRRANDRTRSPRHDHYLTYRFCIPENLRPGHYTLVLHVTDAITHCTTQRTLPLRVTTRPLNSQ